MVPTIAAHLIFYRLKFTINLERSAFFIRQNNNNKQESGHHFFNADNLVICHIELHVIASA